MLDNATAVHARNVRVRRGVPYNYKGRFAHVVYNDKRAARRRGLDRGAKPARYILRDDTFRHVFFSLFAHRKNLVKLFSGNEGRVVLFKSKKAKAARGQSDCV